MMTTKYILRPITNTSWILLSGDERLGIVSEINKEIKIFGKLDKKSYKSLDEFKKSLGDVTIESPPEPKEEPEAGEIDGFPIKHTIWHNVEKDPVCSYTRTQNSKTRYAAGYYAFKFANGWSQSFCPKLATLSEHNYIGPFTTQLELRNSISQKNREKDI